MPHNRATVQTPDPPTSKLSFPDGSSPADDTSMHDFFSDNDVDHEDSDAPSDGDDAYEQPKRVHKSQSMHGSNACRAPDTQDKSFGRRRDTDYAQWKDGRPVGPFRGVSRKHPGRFRVRVTVKGVKKQVGSYPNEFKAARAYDVAVVNEYKLHLRQKNHHVATNFDLEDYLDLFTGVCLDA